MKLAKLDEPSDIHYAGEKHSSKQFVSIIFFISKEERTK